MFTSTVACWWWLECEETVYEVRLDNEDLLPVRIHAVRSSAFVALDFQRVLNARKSRRGPVPPAIRGVVLFPKIQQLFITHVEN